MPERFGSSSEPSMPAQAHERQEIPILAEALRNEQGRLEDYRQMKMLYEAARLWKAMNPTADFSQEAETLTWELKKFPFFSGASEDMLRGEMQRLFERGLAAFEREVQKVSEYEVETEKKIAILKTGQFPRFEGVSYE